MELLVLIAPLLLMIAAGASAHRRNRQFWQASFQAAAVSTAMLTVGLLLLYAGLLPRPVDTDGLIVLAILFIGTAFVSWIVALLVGLYFAGYRPFERQKQGGDRFIPRFTIMQILMTTAFVAIVLTFLQTEGRIHYGNYIEGMGFLANGRQLAVAKLNAWNPISRQSLSHGRFARTVSLLATDDGASKTIQLDIGPPWHGSVSSFASFGKVSIATLKSTNSLMVKEFGAGCDLVLRSIDENVPPQTVRIPDGFFSFALSPDETRVAVSHFDTLEVIDLSTAKSIANNTYWRNAFSWGASRMSFSDNGTLLAAGGDGEVLVWDITTGLNGFSLEREHMPFPYPVQFVPHRSRLAVGVQGGVELFDLQGKLVHRFPIVGPCRAIAASPDGKLVAAAYEAGVALFDVDTMEQVRTFDWSDPSCLTFSPDSTQLAVGDFNGLVILVDVATGNQLWQVSPPSAESWTWTVPYAMLAVWVVACIGLAWRSVKLKVDNQSEPGE